MRGIQALAIAFLFIIGGSAHASPPVYPDHPADAGLVNDFAGVMTTPQKGGLEHDLRNFERTTKAELAVVTVTSLKGQDVDTYANGLFRAWGIGKKGANNGVLLLISTGDRKVKIEVGYGLEPLLTDADSFVIINDVIKPPYKSGDRAKAIIDGSHAIMTKLAPGLKAEGTEIMKKARPKSSHHGRLLAIMAFAAVIILGFIWWIIYQATKDHPSEDDQDDSDEHLDLRPVQPVHSSTQERRHHNDDSGLLAGVVTGAALASSHRDDDEEETRRASTFDASDDDDSLPSSSGDSGGGGFDMGGGDAGGGGASGDL